MSLLARLWRWTWRILLILVLIDAGYLIGIWPDWEQYRRGPVPESNFIRAYRAEQAQRSDWPPLRWSPVPLESIPQGVIRAVVVAEDSRFYEHAGVDLEALRQAMETNLSEQRMAYGASTISQQTVKNLFLSRSRNPLRKWHELVITLGMERSLSKKRILELYLNVAEFGRGIYGVDAAAKHYWGIPVHRLSNRQAIELAATLPSPLRSNPATRSKAFQRRVRKIRRYF